MSEFIIRIDRSTGKVLGVSVKQGDEVIPIEPEGNIYTDNEDKILHIKELRDEHHRHFSVPLELWEKKGNTICCIMVGGNIYYYRC